MNTAITSAAAQASALTESTSFESLSASWIEYLQVSATSVKDYTRAVRQFVRYLAEHSVSRPQRSDVIAYRESLRASKKPATVRLYMTAVRLFSDGWRLSTSMKMLLRTSKAQRLTDLTRRTI